MKVETLKFYNSFKWQLLDNISISNNFRIWIIQMDRKRRHPGPDDFDHYEIIYSENPPLDGSLPDPNDQFQFIEVHIWWKKRWFDNWKALVLIYRYAEKFWK